MLAENGDEIIDPDTYDIGNGRTLHVFLTGTDETGRKLWACSVYDHGPFCCLCQEVDDALNALLLNVLDGRMECRQGPDGEFRFKVTQTGYDAVHAMIKRAGGGPHGC